jgi:hypothetical protein
MNEIRIVLQLENSKLPTIKTFIDKKKAYEYYNSLSGSLSNVKKYTLKNGEGIVSDNKSSVFIFTEDPVKELNSNL